MSNGHPLKTIVQDVETRIAFHRRWRRIWSATYFTGSAASVVTAAAATASAGFITSAGEGKVLTAGLAFAATVFTSLEKVLRTREKWDLHRNSQQALEIVRLNAVADTPESRGLVSQIEAIVQSYGLQLGDLSAAAATKESGE
jgi:hypothetical protein